MVSGDFDAQAKLSKGWQHAGYRMTLYSDPEE